jgi:hypothetical protein
MCTLACASDFDCLDVDSNGLCIPTSPDATEGVCVLGCVAGDGLLGEVKCGGRLDMACLPVDTFAFCVPMCGTDDDCPDGRVCDLGFGHCVDELPPGDPIGAACDPEDGSTCSSAYCLAVGEDFGMCSGACRTGTIGCGSGNAMPEDPGEPICLALGGVGIDGDYGSCVQRCNCDLDCLHPDAKCWAIGESDEETIAEIGTVGLCIDGALADDPDFADERLGIECEDRPDPGSPEAGPPPPDGGPVLSNDSGLTSEPDAATPDPVSSSDAATAADGG